mmetsp:Transcript_14291/g.39298  ORF Transcript_14291/g.39298 Transcript_14291/m.39298 type:complete len:213 (+) Transcript_14291:339-977(+)
MCSCNVIMLLFAVSLGVISELRHGAHALQNPCRSHLRHGCSSILHRCGEVFHQLAFAWSDCGQDNQCSTAHRPILAQRLTNDCRDDHRIIGPTNVTKSSRCCLANLASLVCQQVCQGLHCEFVSNRSYASQGFRSCLSHQKGMVVGGELEHCSYGFLTSRRFSQKSVSVRASSEVPVLKEDKLRLHHTEVHECLESGCSHVLVRAADHRCYG